MQVHAELQQPLANSPFAAAFEGASSYAQCRLFRAFDPYLGNVDCIAVWDGSSAQFHTLDGSAGWDAGIASVALAEHVFAGEFLPSHLRRSRSLAEAFEALGWQQIA